MRKRYYWLIIALVVSALLVSCIGAYLKYGVMGPLGLYQDKNIVALPFLYISDAGMRRAVQEAQTETELPETSNPPQTTAPETTGVTTQPEDITTSGLTETTTVPQTTPTTTVPPTTTQPKTDPPVTDPKENTDSPNLSFAGPAADDAWFEDVLFIGDSRICGLRDIVRSGNADYFCGVGMSVFNILDKTASDKGFSEQSLKSLLASKSYGKIFISLGINECGYPLNSLMKAYKELVDMVKAAQPDAKIILQGIMTVGRKKAAQASYFEPSNLQKINDEIMALADGQKILYIDVNESFADADGYLPKEMSSDGCHLYAKYDLVWEDWIRHAVMDLGI